MKIVETVLDEAVSFHFPQLLGEGGTLYIQVVRQLLAVEGDFKFPAVPAPRHGIEIGHDAAADRLRRGVEGAAGEQQVFARRDEEQVLDQLQIPAGAFVLRGNSDADKKDAAVFVGADVDEQRLAPGDGIDLGEEIAGLGQLQNGAAAPEIVAFDGHRAAQDDPHFQSCIAGVQDGLALPVFPLAGAESVEGGLQFCVCHAGKQYGGTDLRPVFKCFGTHFALPIHNTLPEI